MADERSATAPGLGADWSSVDAICRQRSVMLEINDPYSLAPLYLIDRERLSARFPGVEHQDDCWLGKNYRDQPKVWKYGCDRGCVARAANAL